MNYDTRIATGRERESGRGRERERERVVEYKCEPVIKGEKK